MFLIDWRSTNENGSRPWITISNNAFTLTAFVDQNTGDDVEVEDPFLISLSCSECSRSMCGFKLDHHVLGVSFPSRWHLHIQTSLVPSCREKKRFAILKVVTWFSFDELILDEEKINIDYQCK